MTLVDLVFPLLIVLFLCSEAVFSGSEIAMVSADRQTLRRKRKRGSRKAARVLGFLESPERLFTVTLIGTNLSQVASAMLAHDFFERSLGPHLAVYSALLMIPLVVTFGEALPKAWMRRHADRVVVWLVFPLTVADWILTPAAAVLTRIVHLVAKATRRLFRLEGSPTVTREELRILLRGISIEGVSNKDQGAIADGLLKLSQRRVHEIMVPAPDVVCAKVTDTPAQVAALARRRGFSRIFLYEKGRGDIVGFVHVMDLLAAREGEKEVGRLLRRPYYVPELAHLHSVLAGFLSSRREVAVVVDEYGATTGILALEDIAEMVVGQIADEFDIDRGPLLTDLGEGRFIVGGRVHVDDLRALGFAWEGRAATVAALLVEVAEKVPLSGESYQVGNATFRVIAGSARRVRKVLVEIPPAPAGEREPVPSEEKLGGDLR